MTILTYEIGDKKANTLSQAIKLSEELNLPYKAVYTSDLDPDFEIVNKQFEEAD